MSFKFKRFFLLSSMLCLSGCTSEYLLAGAFTPFVSRSPEDGPLRYWGYVDAKGGQARFEKITAIAVDSQENVYVADSGNNRIRKIDPQGRVSTFMALDQDSLSLDASKPSETPVNSPRGMTIFKDVMYLSFGRCIRSIDLKRVNVLVENYYGNCSLQDDREQSLSALPGLTHDKQGNLYVKSGAVFRGKDEPGNATYKIDTEKNISRVDNYYGGLGDDYFVADGSGCLIGVYDRSEGESLIKENTLNSSCRKMPLKSGFFRGSDAPIDPRLDLEHIFAIAMGKSDDLYIFGKWLATLSIQGELSFVAPLNGFQGRLVTINDDETVIYSARDTAVYRWDIPPRRMH